MDRVSLLSLSLASESAPSTLSVNGFGPPFNPWVEGAPDGLKCQMCNNAWAEVLCPDCGEGAFCTAMCLWKATHGDEKADHFHHDCPGGYETSADELCESITLKLPFDAYTHRQFFCHCDKNDVEKVRVVYEFIIERLLITKFQLNNWRRGNCLYRNIIAAINRNLDSVPEDVFKYSQATMLRVFQARENTSTKPNVAKFQELKEAGQTGQEPRVQRQ